MKICKSSELLSQNQQYIYLGISVKHFVLHRISKTLLYVWDLGEGRAENIAEKLAIFEAKGKMVQYWPRHMALLMYLGERWNRFLKRYLRWDARAGGRGGCGDVQKK